MKKLKWVFPLLFIPTLQVFTQDQLLTVENVAINAYQKFSPNNLRQLNWSSGKDNFVWITGSSENSALATSSQSKTEIDTLLRLSELNSYKGMLELRIIYAS